MLPIRKRISRPFLLLIVLIPVTTVLLFNLIVSVYNQKEAEEELTAAVERVTRVMENDNVENALPFIIGQNLTTAAEVVTYNKNGEVSRFFNFRDSFVTQEIASKAYEEIQNLEHEEIGSFRHENETYYALSVNYSGKSVTDTIIYISKGLTIDGFVETVNIVLISVSAVITVVALFVSGKVTNAIARPIEMLTNQIEGMKSDELLYIENNSDSIEIGRLTEEINSLNKRIYQYNQSQKNFLHNASHELRTPLMSIQGYADGIEMGIFEDAKGTAHLISDQSKRLTSLVDSLLTLARAENFSGKEKLQVLNLSDELSDLISRYSGLAVTSGIEIKSSIKEDIFAKAKSELLSGSVGNIISNALRYAKSTVEISLTERDGLAVITVKDDGEGIADPTVIFERFSKGEGGNFGLGLSIAKTSALMMGGNIKAYNSGGAVFEVEIAAVKLA